MAVRYTAGDPVSLARATRELAEARERIPEWSEAAFRAGRETFDRARTYPLFAEWLEEVCGSGVPPLGRDEKRRDVASTG